MLEETQSGDLNITKWLEWFLNCLDRALSATDEILAAVINKVAFWKKYAAVRINDRQQNMLDKMLNGFDGKLTTAKWAKIAKSSHDTALRDIQDLIEKGVPVKDAAGSRSTSYSLNL